MFPLCLFSKSLALLVVTEVCLVLATTLLPTMIDLTGGACYDLVMYVTGRYDAKPRASGKTFCECLDRSELVEHTGGCDIRLIQLI